MVKDLILFFNRLHFCATRLLSQVNQLQKGIVSLAKVEEKRKRGKKES